MLAEREMMYRNLEEHMYRTPLTEFKLYPVPNGNRILQKEESNTMGTGDLIGTSLPLNHYGRVFPAVYKALEAAGRIRPGDFVFDSSQGNAALALTVIGNYLGFQPHAIVPNGHLPKRMINLLDQAGARLILTEGTDYGNDFEPKIKDVMRRQRSTKGFLNHSMNTNHTNNETTLKALGAVGTEILQQLREGYGLGRPDYLIGVWGNGSSLFAPGRVLASHGTKVIGWELFSQAVAHELAYPGRYTEQFGIPLTVPMREPFTGLTSIHGVPGSSYRGKGVPINFPHIRNAVTGPQKVITDTKLFTDSRMLQAFGDLATDVPVLKPMADNYIRRALELPRLDIAARDFGERFDLGRTSVGNLALALKLAEEVENSVIVTFVYDRLSQKYDTPYPK